MSFFTIKNKMCKFGLIGVINLFVVINIQSQANAQSGAFTGLTIEAASGYQSMRLSAKNLTVSNPKLRINNRSIPNNIAPQNISGIPFALNVGYVFGFNESATIGIRFEYNPQSNRYAAVILPGYALTDRAQGYLRLGWAYMATTIGSTFPGAQAQSQTAYFNGPTIGIGAKYKVIDSLYLYGELNYYQYNDVKMAAVIGNNQFTGTVSSRAANVLVGIGYTF